MSQIPSEILTHVLPTDQEHGSAALLSKIKTLEAVVDRLQRKLQGLGPLVENEVVPENGEPFFLLVARDPMAPVMVEAWANLRQGKISEASIGLESLLKPTLIVEAQAAHDPQIRYAFNTARKMRNWSTAQAVRETQHEK